MEPKELSFTKMQPKTQGLECLWPRESTTTRTAGAWSASFRVSGGFRARVVQVDEAGNLSFAKRKVSSTDPPTKVEKAVDKGKRLADASEVLANTAFLEANPGELIVFGSKNAPALTGGKEIEQGYYLVTKSPAEILSEQLTEKRKEVAELEKKLGEAIKTEKREEVQMKNNRGEIGSNSNHKTFQTRCQYRRQKKRARSQSDRMKGSTVESVRLGN